MAGDGNALTEKPFRLMDLAPELRTRIYECYFEPEEFTFTEVDVLEIAEHAPCQAITAVSKLLRHETYQLYRDAEKDFFQRSFVMDWCSYTRRCESKLFRAEIDAKLELLDALPPYPISRLEVRLETATNGNHYTYYVITTDASGLIRETFEQGHMDECGHCGYDNPAKTTTLQRHAAALRRPLTRPGRPSHLILVHVVEAALFSDGWVGCPGRKVEDSDSDESEEDPDRDDDDDEGETDESEDETDREESEEESQMGESGGEESDAHE
ncbi:hypothetical protein LTR97_004221 [Elasticomyces elasticus]|uniref:Uncharacterized protein n=1 Tax=Elasticomyces elasticus TaxID=574655 RepID=A0AAN7W8R6_9PEZI|nr:hypothetical protein LTR97_004221 [Elasticomyces elasticus]